ncbi:MAG: hypothetical protein ABJ387_01390 [Balneola sp.]
MGKPRPLRFLKRVFIDSWSKPVGDTLRGDNELGQELNKYLPAKEIREIGGSVLFGIRDVVTAPQIKDAKQQAKIDAVRNAIKEKKITKEVIEEMDAKSLQELGYQLFDLVDDGKLNQSADALSPETKLKIRIGSAALFAVYAIYALITGDFTLIEAAKFFMGFNS